MKQKLLSVLVISFQKSYLARLTIYEMAELIEGRPARIDIVYKQSLDLVD